MAKYRPSETSVAMMSWLVAAISFMDIWYSCVIVLVIVVELLGFGVWKVGETGVFSRTLLGGTGGLYWLAGFFPICFHSPGANRFFCGLAGADM